MTNRSSRKTTRRFPFSQRFSAKSVIFPFAFLLAGVFYLGLTGTGFAGQGNLVLFTELPDFCPTPDGMAVASDGSLVVACPNFADQSKPACLIKVDRQGQVKKWIDVPPLPETGVACPMGICFGPDGDLYLADNQGWTGNEKGKFRGRLLRLRIRNGRLEKTTVIAHGMEHPNGVKFHHGDLYVTQSLLTKIKDDSGLLTSGVYRFSPDDNDVKVTNTDDDPNLLLTVTTKNRDCQYGLDGLAFDRDGNLYLGNFGDGAILKVTFADDRKTVESCKVWARNPREMRTTDGICFDTSGNLYVADFSENAVAVVRPDGSVRRLARSPNCDGSQGGLDQPGEPIVFDGRLILSCFDIVTGKNIVNTKHDKPFTLTSLKLAKPRKGTP